MSLSWNEIRDRAHHQTTWYFPIRMFPNFSLADLYDPTSMPPALVKAHQRLDKAVDAAYGKSAAADATEAERVAFLFERYQELVSPLMASEGKKASKRTRITQ